MWTDKRKCVVSLGMMGVFILLCAVSMCTAGCTIFKATKVTAKVIQVAQREIYVEVDGQASVSVEFFPDGNIQKASLDNKKETVSIGEVLGKGANLIMMKEINAD